jgi:hypothetical protein
MLEAADTLAKWITSLPRSKETLSLMMDIFTGVFLGTSYRQDGKGGFTVYAHTGMEACTVSRRGIVATYNGLSWNIFADPPSTWEPF